MTENMRSGSGSDDWLGVQYEAEAERRIKPTPNVPLLRKVVEWAEAEHEKEMRGEFCEWDQNNWATTNWCGTAFCIAGKTVMLTQENVTLKPPMHGGRALATDGLDLFIDGEPRSWEEVATRELGLTVAEADYLFGGDNDIEQVRYYAERIAERAGERL